MLFQIFWEYKKGNDIYDTIQNQVLDTDTPTSVTLDDEEVEIPFVYDHKQLLSINSKDLAIFTFLQLMYGFRWSSLQIMIFI